MRILSIESSCDETGASVVENKNGKIEVLSNILATSSDMHAKTGGIIPEDAAREQIKTIIPVIVEALIKSEHIDTSDFRENFVKARKILKENIDGIAVTYGPGLIGSLLIGVETVKAISLALEKPIYPVNHLLAHIYANFISSNSKSYKLKAISFPLIGLIVSGGHTDLLYFKSHTDYEWLGGTRDDAAGEALDKIGRMLSLSYPAGPEIERRANDFKLKTEPASPSLGGNLKSQIKFQSPMLGSKDFDFSFSGLKSEVMRFIMGKELNEDLKNEICYAVQIAVIDVLIKKTLNAAEKYKCKTVLLGGGVSANKTLLEEFQLNAKRLSLNPKIHAPMREFATDNAAMIGAYALINGQKVSWDELKSNPELYFA